MNQKFWQTPEFKQLEKEWYKKLEKNKFKDIEKNKNHGFGGYQLASNSYRGASLVEREAKLKFYELMGEALWRENSFRDEVERFVMHRRSEGAPIKAICCELKEMGARCHRVTIERIVREYIDKWQIRKYVDKCRVRKK
jgi:hypothetical protein